MLRDGEVSRAQPPRKTRANRNRCWNRILVVVAGICLSGLQNKTTSTVPCCRASCARGSERRPHQQTPTKQPDVTASWLFHPSNDATSAFDDQSTAKKHKSIHGLGRHPHAVVEVRRTREPRAQPPSPLRAFDLEEGIAAPFSHKESRLAARHRQKQRPNGTLSFSVVKDPNDPNTQIAPQPVISGLLFQER